MSHEDHRLTQDKLHRALLSGLSDVVVSHSDVDQKPLEIDLKPPLPPRVRAYVFNATRPPGGRPVGEHKIQLIMPGQSRGNRANFDRSGGRIVLLMGYAGHEDVFVLWDSDLYRDFAWSRNVQIRTPAIVAAVAGEVGRQERILRPAGRSRVLEEVFTANARMLAEAIQRRIDASRRRLANE